jgi:hypothetical protein
MKELASIKLKRNEKTTLKNILIWIHEEHKEKIGIMLILC